ncbi:MAG: class I SAM-dependent methyltransferase [Methanoregula sp.]|nr:class I SAM-dependent methyltransferase [Methanoregula sp.]
MEHYKIRFDKEKETLLVPLICKARESVKENAIISDQNAVRMVESIDYDFTSLKVPKQTHVTICIRAKKIDQYTEEFQKSSPDGTVLSLGCGLDSRFFRVDNGRTRWYDLDYPDVIELKRSFHSESDRYHLLPSSVTNLEWTDIPAKNPGPFLIIAEGLFMYLPDKDVRSVVLKLQAVFPGSLLIFDAFSEKAVKGMAKHPSIGKTGAGVCWGTDDAGEIERWNEGISLVEEWYFTQSDEIRKLDLSYRLFFRIAGLFSAARKAHRILAFRLG